MLGMATCVDSGCEQYCLNKLPTANLLCVLQVGSGHAHALCIGAWQLPAQLVHACLPACECKSAAVVAMPQN